MTEKAERAQVTDAQARKTALIVAAVVVAIAGWNFYRGRIIVASVFGVAGGLLLLAGLLFPTLARAFHIFWMRVAAALGYVNSRIILSVMYYGVFTPYSLVSRLAGRDPLKRRGAPDDSYWIERQRTRQTKEQFERLF